ncbi:hypothetical protein BCD67_22820 [Oscillatoriales cyanobacterium USR001]|nr:hypothetical protein BCD67_22820 [Oscillatoriales cyanobacterium USR001]
MKINVFDRFVLFLQNLEQQGLSYTLTHQRDEAIMVTVAVPGERWEVEFLSDGSAEVEKFISNGGITGEESLKELLSRYSEQENLIPESRQNNAAASLNLVTN